MQCEKCVYFVPGKYSHTGSCKRYIAYKGRGKLVYEFADSVRLAENKCGRQGRFFIAKEKSRVFRDLLEDED
jgi:hypothetical protein